MSYDTNRLAASAAAVRAIILDPSELAGPSNPVAPLERNERLRGGEFVMWDARRDACMLMTGLLDHQLTDPVVRAVNRAIESPTIRRLRAVEAALRSPVPRDAEQACRLTADLLPFHMAALGCPIASAYIAAAALDAASMRIDCGDHRHAFLSLRCALLWSSDAQADASDLEYVGGPLASRLASFDQRAHIWLKSFRVFSLAESLISDEDAILRGGAGVRPADFDLDLGLAPGDPVPLPARRAPSAGRTLVVVPDLGHLPAPSKSVQDRRDSPRAEFEAIAGRPLPLRPAPDPHTFVEEGAARSPWLRPVFETLAQDLVGAPHAWIRPTLLVGGPGAGKTAAAARIATALGLPFRVYGVTSTADGTFAGTSRQWSSGRASIPAQTVRQEECASVAIVVDEIEKGTPDRRNGRLDEALLPFLERESSRRLFDPYLECPLDLSAVTYLATANDLQGVPGPLRDRFRIIRVPLPRREDMAIVAANIVADVRQERGLDAAWLPDLDGEELALLGRHWRGGSLRPLRRLVETMLSGRDRLAPRH